MRYLEIDTGPPLRETGLPWWVKLLQLISPAGNPDLEPIIHQVQIWWLETDDNGEPLREIGFNAKGQAVVLGPVNGNTGFLIDASDDWSDSNEVSAKAAEEFNSVWNSLWPKFEELDRRNRSK